MASSLLYIVGTGLIFIACLTGLDVSLSHTMHYKIFGHPVPAHLVLSAYRPSLAAPEQA